MQYDFTNLMQSEKVKRGISEARLKNANNLCRIAHEDVFADRKRDILGFYELPQRNIGHILAFAEQASRRFDNMVVLGIGGSALGNKALYSALKVEKNLSKKVYVADNVDPYQLYEILELCPLEKTIFNVITKSGTTAETMATFLIVLDLLKKSFPKDYQKHLVITTDAEKGFLRKIVAEEKITSFVVPDNVGGRFTVLSDVGLVSSAFAGIEVAELLKGADAMRISCEKPELEQNPAYLNGLLHYLYMQDKYNISVMMPYANSLYDFADWYRQLWAESLGKRYSIYGQEVFTGQTPVKALGTTDQHSQVQLYTEGPHDKVVTLIKVDSFKHDYFIPDLYPERSEINYLGGKKLSSLLNAEALATEKALTDAGRPNCTLTLPNIGEYELGQFIFMYEVQTVFTGKLLNIDPLDQPGVEAGKIATYAMMGKKGFAQEKANIEDYLAQKKKKGYQI